MNKNSSPTQKNRVSVVISGDVTKDHIIAVVQENIGGKQDWSTTSFAFDTPQRGGVLMLDDLIRSTVKHSKEILDKKIVISCPQTYSNKSFKNVDSFYAKWSQFERDLSNPDKEKVKEKVWRVEEFLGFEECRNKIQKFSVENDDENANIVVLEDSNLGFRNPDLNKENVVKEKDVALWSKALARKENPPWVLVKMSNPIANGNLWTYLQNEHSDKLIGLLSIEDLRFSDVQISRELSWELTAQDLVRELIYNQSVNSLSNCAFVIVLFGADGAILLSSSNSSKRNKDNFPISKLFFDPKCIEGMWRKNYPGGMIGYKTCMAISVTLSLLQNDTNPNMEEAVKRGLCAMRKLHLEGYERKNSKNVGARLAFPTEMIGSFIAKFPKDDETFAQCFIPSPFNESNLVKNNQELWTILKEKQGDLDKVAWKIVLEGAEKVLKDVPLGKFNHLLTVDRREIEGFRSIRNLVSEYAKAGANKPLSIAVFGAPGSGKSFGISQMAESLLPGKIKKLTFNLSQFGLSKDLWGAFHQVRDVSLTGKIPLVFWDEFDTTFEGKPLGWLRYFLAPMQDGEFQEGQITHPIGQAIFVFAGGTVETMKDFEESLKDKPENSDEANAPNLNDDVRQKEAKLPDFISRLKGFVNVLGPNPTKSNNQNRAGKTNFHLIRRAVLLRSLLERNTPQFFDKETKILRIDNGVLRALLEVPKYKHGVRSMESVIAMSLTESKSKYERSALPSETQLDLHVNANDFMSLVYQIDFSTEITLLDKLAHYLHEEVYAKIYPPKSGEKVKPYHELEEHKKELNREFIKEIPDKLRVCNSLVVATRDYYESFKFTDEEVDQLAMMEHERWLKEKIKDGFRYASKEEIKKEQKQNLEVRLNSLMRFWDELSPKEFENQPEYIKQAVGRDSLTEQEKENNRKLVRSIPEILASIGYTIVRK